MTSIARTTQNPNYCACVTQLPSPKTCSQCQNSTISEIAVKNIPDIPSQAHVLENVIVIHGSPVLGKCTLAENLRYLRETGQLKWLCVIPCVVLVGGVITAAVLGAHGNL